MAKNADKDFSKDDGSDIAKIKRALGNLGIQEFKEFADAFSPEVEEKIQSNEETKLDDTASDEAPTN